MILELSYGVFGEQPLHADHGYQLYGALSRLLPAIHANPHVAIQPICGRQIGERKLLLMPFSVLTVRIPDDLIASFLPLAGKSLRIGESTIRVGVPQVRSLIAAPALRSRLVTIRNGLEPERFKLELRRKLAEMNVAAESEVTLGKRRTIKIKQREIVGYEVILEGLSAEESLAIQENRTATPELGFARRHMGCGVFVPIEGRRE